MKQIIITIIIAIASAMSAKAQVITSETIKNVYETVTNQSKSDFVFNAERTGNDITTMYIYRKVRSGKDVVTLKPHLKYDYCYAPDGTLSSRVTYRWADALDTWSCAARHDFALDGGKYSSSYSRYNPASNSFDQPVDMMVYLLMPYDSVSHVSSYHRNDATSQFQLVSETIVNSHPMLLAEK